MCGLFISCAQGFTIWPKKFVERIYEKNPTLSRNCGWHILHILSPFQNEQGTITVTNKIRKRICGRTMAYRNTHTRGGVEYVAAVVLYKTLQEIHAEQKDQKTQCSICLEQDVPNKKELTCSHAFCLGCIITWFAQDLPELSGAHTTCPVCRTQIALRIQNELKKHSLYEKTLLESLDKFAKEEEEQSSLDVLIGDEDGLGVDQLANFLSGLSPEDYNSFVSQFRDFSDHYQDQITQDADGNFSVTFDLTLGQQ